jgi:hypothetical protein
MVTTVGDVINQSLKKAGILGVGQTALAEDSNDAFADLIDLLSQWQRKRWLTWNLIDTFITSTGAVSYTIGTGQNFNIARPDRIEAAFFRQLINTSPNQVDYPLEIIPARETYNQIALKSLTSWPQYIFYDSAYPVGNVYVWPVPQASLFEIHLTLKVPFSTISNLSTNIVMPPEYIPAIKWNLAVRLRESYQLPPSVALAKLAQESLDVIRGANVQVPLLQCDKTLIRGGLYSIYSDQIY